MGRINPPAFTAAHQGSTSLPVRAVRMIIPPGLDDEDIIFQKHTQKTEAALRLFPVNFPFLNVLQSGYSVLFLV